MKLLPALFVSICIFSPLFSQSDTPAHKPTREEKHAPDAAQKAEAARVKKQKEEAQRQAEWDKSVAQNQKWMAEHPAPAAAPAYPGTVRPQYAGAVRQAVALLDNDVNTAVNGSAVEFSLTNPGAMQTAAYVIGSATTPGEQQVAQALASYAESPAICWNSRGEGGSVLMAAILGSIRRCQQIAADRRSTLDLTFQQNLRPALGIVAEVAPPPPPDVAPSPAPPVPALEYPVRLGSGREKFAVQIATGRALRIGVGVDGGAIEWREISIGMGPKIEAQSVVKLRAEKLEDVAVFVDEKPIRGLAGAGVDFVVK